MKRSRCGRRGLRASSTHGWASEGVGEARHLLFGEPAPLPPSLLRVNEEREARRSAIGLVLCGKRALVDTLHRHLQVERAGEACAVRERLPPAQAAASAFAAGARLCAMMVYDRMLAVVGSYCYAKAYTTATYELWIVLSCMSHDR